MGAIFYACNINGTEFWDTQLGRVKFANGVAYDDNTSITRLSHLNYATDVGSFKMKRGEGAINYSKTKLLTAGLDTSGTMHFALYDLAMLSGKMDEVDSSHGHVDLSKVKKQGAFHIPNFTNQLGHSSIQGFELSDGNAIYVSSGAPGATPSVSKFYWGNKISFSTVFLCNSEWWTPWKIETEGIQLGGDLQINIAYHDVNDHDKTKANKIFKFDKK